MSVAPDPGPAPIGHNSGADLLAVRADFEERVRTFLSGADVWSKREALDDELAPRARDFIAGAKKLVGEAEKARRAEKIPHEQECKKIDAEWALIRTRVEKIIGVVEPKLSAYLREQQRRADDARRLREAEAAEAQRRAEAAATEAAMAQSASGRIEAEARAEAAAKDAEAAQKSAAAVADARVGSATGLARTASLKTVRRARIENLGLAVAHYRERLEMAELVERLANAELRAAPTVQGVKQVPTIPGIAWDETQEITA